jgi:hypothetical protein
MPVVVVSISGNVSEGAVRDALGKDVSLGRGISLYTITAGAPDQHFMKYEAQLRQFGESWSRLMGMIRSISPKVEYLPIFSAVPIPVAIRMGMLHLQADPSWWIYELRTTKGGWEKAIELR